MLKRRILRDWLALDFIVFNAPVRTKVATLGYFKDWLDFKESILKEHYLNLALEGKLSEEVLSEDVDFVTEASIIKEAKHKAMKAKKKAKAKMKKKKKTKAKSIKKKAKKLKESFDVDIDSAIAVATATELAVESIKEYFNNNVEASLENHEVLDVIFKESLDNSEETSDDLNDLDFDF